MTSQVDKGLSAEAEAAWLAYLAMGDSKKTYFYFMQALNRKYDRHQSPTLAENLKLESLLAAHAEKVRAFNTAMAAVTDVCNRASLLAKLTSASST